MSERIRVQRFINKECIDFGICFNWNWRAGIEISFFFWTIYIEFEPLDRFKERRRLKRW